MPKPTSPQPPGLTESEYTKLMDAYTGAPISLYDFAQLAFDTGCKAQRKVDAEIARDAAKKALGHYWNKGEEFALEIAAAIERTPEQPTTKRCGTCGSDDPRLVQTQKGMAEQSIDALCPNKRFHSQPTTGEAGDEPNRT